MSRGARGPFRGERAAHLDALTRPESAIISGRATGAEGDRVGVAGVSVSNTGVHAESQHAIGLRARGGELAAEFEGGVLVNGDLTIEGQLSAPVVADLLDRVRELEQRVFNLSRRVLQLQTTINRWATRSLRVVPEMTLSGNAHGLVPSLKAWRTRQAPVVGKI